MVCDIGLEERSRDRLVVKDRGKLVRCLGASGWWTWVVSGVLFGFGMRKEGSGLEYLWVRLGVSGAG